MREEDDKDMHPQGNDREDDRNVEIDESPVPDPESDDGDESDDPGAD
jgi:hypothetical protein